MNPDAKDGVKENTVLTLPSSVKVVATKTTLNKYEYQVQQGETLYAISKKIGISVDEMIKNNPTSKEGVAAGQLLAYFAPKKYISATSQVVKNDVIVKKEGRLEVEEDLTKRNYLHLKAGSLGSNLGAGLFTK